MSQPVTDPDLLRLLNGDDAPAPRAGPVYGAPAKPETPREPKTTFRTLTPDEVAARGLPPGSYQISSEGKVDKLADAPKNAQTEDQRSQAKQSLMETIDKLDNLAFDALDNGGWGETGLTGSVMSGVPGTAARDLSGMITSVQANTAFDKLQNMKMNSPNGGGLGGNTSDTDMALLKSSVANLDQGQSSPAFFGNVAQAKRSYLQMLGRIDPEAAASYAKKKGIRFDEKGNPTLVYVDGEDTREKRDPFGVLPQGGGNDGGTPPPSGLDPNIYNPEGAQGVFDLAKQGITQGLLDEAAGAGGYLGALLTGDDPSKAYTRERDASRENIRRARVAHPVVGTLAEFLGGGAGVKVAQGTMTLVNMVRQGAVTGALGGFGYGEGDNSLASAAGGAAVGGALGGAFGGVSKFIEGRMARGALAPDQINVIEAGQRQNIPIRQPDVRPDLRGKYAAMESTEYGGKIINQGRAVDVAAISDRAAEVAGGSAFSRADTTAMGQNVQKIAQRGQDGVKDSASKMYRRVEQSAPDFKAPPTNTTRAIDETIADLRAKSPSGYNDVIGALEGMKSDLAETGLSVASLQAQRETIGGRIGDNVQDRSRADAIFTKVLKVAGQEMQDALRAENPQAAAILKRADAKWGQYKDLQKEVTGLFLGKRGDATAETAARSLNAATRNNYSALRRFMALATPDEKADFAATFVQNWGANQRGEFSPAIFAKSMEGVSDRTLSTVLGTKGKEALRDLQAISNAKTDAMSRQAPSGKAMERAANGLKTTLMMLFGFTAGGGAGAAAGFAARPFLAALGEKRAARMLMNPNFTKLLRNAPNTTDPATINRYFSRVAGVIGANDNEAFTSALTSAFSKSPGRAAADEEANGRREPPQ